MRALPEHISITVCIAKDYKLPEHLRPEALWRPALQHISRQFAGDVRLRIVTQPQVDMDGGITLVNASRVDPL